MAKLDDLEREMNETETVTESVVTLVEGLAQQIRDAGVDQGKLDTLAKRLDANSTRLAEAVVRHTPADPSTPTPDPSPEPAPPPEPTTPIEPVV